MRQSGARHPVRAAVVAAITMTGRYLKPLVRRLVDGFSLIELMIVVAVMAILLTIAMPGYQRYMLRVHRTEAIGMLLQASMCQQRIYASNGTYDIARCQLDTADMRYEIEYSPADSQGRAYIAMATPMGSQLEDPCGSLSLDQNGARAISTPDVSVTKCWNGR